MKPGKIFFMFSVTLILIIWGGLFYNFTYIESQTFKEQVKDHLISVSESKGERINDWLLEKRQDIEVLAEFSKIKELLEKTSSSSELATKLNVDGHASIVSKEIENYIGAHPGMTLVDLQNSVEFNSIAVRSIGGGGYTTLIDKQTFTTRFHHDPKLVELNYSLANKEDRDSLVLLKKTRSTNEDNSGFYDWVDSNGKIKRKYAYFSVIPVKTLDNFEFILVTTVYVEDYQTIKNIPEDTDSYLNNFRESHNYHNLILISPDGYIVYMNQKMENLGGNLEWKENLDMGLSKNYQDAKRSNNISFFGPFARHYGEKFMKVSIMSPIYNNGELLGFVALIDEMDKVIDISTETSGLWRTGEAYLVNIDSLLISPLRFRHIDMLTQSIKTENLEKCMDQITKNKNSKERMPQLETGQEFYEFQNYKGDLTLGTYKPIPETNWCLLTEIGENEVFEVPIRNQIRGNMLILFATMLFALIFVFYIKIFLDKNYILKERKVWGFFTKYRGRYRNDY